MYYIFSDLKNKYPNEFEDYNISCFRIKICFSFITIHDEPFPTKITEEFEILGLDHTDIFCQASQVPNELPLSETYIKPLKPFQITCEVKQKTLEEKE